MNQEKKEVYDKIIFKKKNPLYLRNDIYSMSFSIALLL